jgi:hypothetical protein
MIKASCVSPPIVLRIYSSKTAVIVKSIMGVPFDVIVVDDRQGISITV